MRNFKDLAHFETFYVVKIHNAFQMADSKPCFYFAQCAAGPPPHARAAPPLVATARLVPTRDSRVRRAAPWRSPNAEAQPDNSRYTALEFDVEVGATLHGFAGFFHSTLYRDVAISTNPETLSEGMFSWFPLYLPLRHPVVVPDGGKVEVHCWRHASSHKVWYEWALVQPQMSPIHNVNGRSYHIGL